MPVRRNELEEVIEVVVFDVGMDELLSLPVHDADVHLVGVEVNSAVELCGRCVVFHNGSFVVGSQDPGLNTFGYAGRCSSTSPLVNPMLTKTTKGFEGSIKIAGAAAGPKSRVIDMTQVALGRRSGSAQLWDR